MYVLTYVLFLCFAFVRIESECLELHLRSTLARSNIHGQSFAAVDILFRSLAGERSILPSRSIAQCKSITGRDSYFGSFNNFFCFDVSIRLLEPALEKD